MSQRIEQDWLNETSIREHINAGGTLINNEQARVLLDEIDRLRGDCDHHKQAALDLSDENDQLRKENMSLNQSAKSLADVNHQLQKELFEQNQLMNELFLKAERLEKLVQPDPERGPGFVGQGTWSVFAEKVVEERDELRDELSSLCEEIRCLKEENDELSDEVKQLGDMISAMKMKTKTKSELTHVHYSHDEFIGIDGYGPFSLKKLCKDRWEISFLREKVILYNRKGHRVRGDLDNSNLNPDRDW
jgi:phage shock protein A